MDYKKFTFLLVATFSLQSFGQNIDPSILSGLDSRQLSELTPEQIEMARELYGFEIPVNSGNDEPTITEESLIEITPAEDGSDILIKKYGYDFFSSMPTSMTAVGDLPFPNDYKISLRDEFTVILSGSKDAIFNLDVKLDGTILFPELGSIQVAGLSLRDVKEKLSNVIQQSYVGVNIDVSLKNLSAKKISIVGAVNTPGTYLVNPFSTISGALAYSGGISDIGSLRDIKLLRTTGEIFSFDLYDLLIKGDRTNDVTIEAGDTILINAASSYVMITGAVNRPAIYEVLEGEKVNDLISFALGFTNTANKSNVSIAFLDLDNASIKRQTVSSLDQDLKNALSIKVFNYVSKDNANIEVLGAVEEPGLYDLDQYETLSDLIGALKFIDVYPWLAVLEQFDDENLIQSSIIFSLNDENTYQSIKLLPNSRLHFANIDNRSFESIGPLARNRIEDYSLTINHKQDSYVLPVVGKYSVKTFIDLLGLDMSDVDKEATYISPLESLVLVQDFNSMEFLAKKYQNISFRSPINDLISVNISGAIEYPGQYTLRSNSNLEDLYSLIGSFRDDAFLTGVILTRESVRERQLKALEQAQNSFKRSYLLALQDSQGSAELSSIESLISSIEPQNLGRIAGDFSPDSATLDKTILFDGDTIVIPKKANVINIIGEVLNPVAFEYSDKLTLQTAIDMAGGYKSSADKKRVYVIKANGITVKVNRNIFIGKNGIEAGDTIVVPAKIISTNPVIKALTPITQVLSDLAFSAAAIDSLSNN